MQTAASWTPPFLFYPPSITAERSAGIAAETLTGRHQPVATRLVVLVAAAAAALTIVAAINVLVIVVIVVNAVLRVILFRVVVVVAVVVDGFWCPGSGRDNRGSRRTDEQRCHGKGR